MLRLLLLALAVMIGGCDRGTVIPPEVDCNFNLAGVEPRAGFFLSDNVMGTVLKASAREDVGRNLTFVGLNAKVAPAHPVWPSAYPRVVFGDGGNMPFTKVFESEEVITLLWVGTGSGSVDVFVIEKKTGKFARAEAGLLIDGVAAFSSVGLCK